MNDITTELKEIFGDRLKENEPMSKHTNFRLGGPAKWYAEVKTAEELLNATRFSNENGFSFVVIGGGSNTLVADEGFDGLVLQMAMRDIKIEGTKVICGAGAISAGVARKTAEAGLAGFEWAISLPGTIGGAARGNAGCFGGEMKDVVASAKVLRNGEIVEIPSSEFKFGYRESAIKHSTDIIIEVTLELTAGDATALKAKLADTLAKRKASQPLYAGSAGCMFKNLDVSEEELAKVSMKLDVPPAMSSTHRLGVGWIVDQLGLKGFKIGGAQISEEHGNFIVNAREATASDVLQVISAVKTRARNELGLQLHEEVQLIGF